MSSTRAKRQIIKKGAKADTKFQKCSLKAPKIYWLRDINQQP